ncbi:hypothetical protein [Alloscardovia criceti]|uniref:hypothetical protein n=1 Tax=Alloscardovia criceti TaxID=356828 RepID=UPI00037B2041|nr:hypothetical protein [Alloscardovia criceti]
MKQGKIVQPIPGGFVESHKWDELSNSEQIRARIVAMAKKHRNWVVSAVSAAALHGAVIHPKFHRNVHFAVDQHTATGRRKTLPVRFHYIKDCRSAPKYKKICTKEFDRKKLRNNGYLALDDRMGVMHGMFVTSPLQTIFDCMRMLPFDQALIVCDALSRIYKISYIQIRNFVIKRQRCWKARVAQFKAKFIDSSSENGGESLCRAIMIRGGFELPKLQSVINNPLFRMKRTKAATLQSTRVIRPDFVWKLKNIGKSKKNFKYIAAELDGRDKYVNPQMLAQQGNRDLMEVALREKDRETALNLCGYKVIRFQFAEAVRNGGNAMLSKLKLAGVPMVSKFEQSRRKRLLAMRLGDVTLHSLE